MVIEKKSYFVNRNSTTYLFSLMSSFFLYTQLYVCKMEASEMPPPSLFGYSSARQT